MTTTIGMPPLEVGCAALWGWRVRGLPCTARRTLSVGAQPSACEWERALCHTVAFLGEAEGQLSRCAVSAARPPLRQFSSIAHLSGRGDLCVRVSGARAGSVSLHA